MQTREVEFLGTGPQRVQPCPTASDNTARLEIYIDLWANESTNIIAAINTARDALCVEIDIEQVEGMSCINVEGFPKDVSVFHIRLLAEGVVVSTTKSR